MPNILDCSNIDSAITSLEPLLGLSNKTIREILVAFDSQAYSNAHPDDSRHLKEFLPVLLRQQGASNNNPDFAYWFHGTRVLDPGTLGLGLKPLNQQIDQLWQDLFQLAQSWVDGKEWQAFRVKVETVDPLESSKLFRRRLSNSIDWGPHAVLIRDSIATPDPDVEWNYLSGPETITDLCDSFLCHYGQDLLAKFREQSVPCIVKFKDRCHRTDLVGNALAYVYSALHNEPFFTCNACFESEGKAVPSDAIVDVEKLSNDR